MLIELKGVNDIYKDNPDGTSDIIKRGVITKLFIDMREVSSVMEIFDEKGKVYKSQCAVHHVDMGRVFLKHKYEFIKELKENGEKIVKVSGYETGSGKRPKARTKAVNRTA